MLTRRTLLATPFASTDWRSLFDGRTTTGWKGIAGQPFPEANWCVADGCLKSLVTKPTFQDLRTVDEFGDFELAFEWKIAPAGNSGIKYLVYKEDVWQPPGATGRNARGRGFEYQLADNTAAKSDLETTGALYGFLAPQHATCRKLGQFNQSRLIRQGQHVEHWLNGKRVLAVQLDSPETLERMRQRKVPAEFPKRSAIVLQNHSAECWFRHLKIRDL